MKDWAKKELRIGQRVMAYEDESTLTDDFTGVVVGLDTVARKVTVEQEVTGKLFECNPKILEVIP